MEKTEKFSALFCMLREFFGDTEYVFLSVRFINLETRSLELFVFYSKLKATGDLGALAATNRTGK